MVPTPRNEIAFLLTEDHAKHLQRFGQNEEGKRVCDAAIAGGATAPVSLTDE